MLTTLNLNKKLIFLNFFLTTKVDIFFNFYWLNRCRIKNIILKKEIFFLENSLLLLAFKSWLFSSRFFFKLTPVKNNAKLTPLPITVIFRPIFFKYQLLMYRKKFVTLESPVSYYHWNLGGLVRKLKKNLNTTKLLVSQKKIDLSRRSFFLKHFLYFYDNNLNYIFLTELLEFQFYQSTFDKKFTENPYLFVGLRGRFGRLLFPWNFTNYLSFFNNRVFRNTYFKFKRSKKYFINRRFKNLNKFSVKKKTKSNVKIYHISSLFRNFFLTSNFKIPSKLFFFSKSLFKNSTKFVLQFLINPSVKKTFYFLTNRRPRLYLKSQQTFASHLNGFFFLTQIKFLPHSSLFQNFKAQNATFLTKNEAYRSVVSIFLKNSWLSKKINFRTPGITTSYSTNISEFALNFFHSHNLPVHSDPNLNIKRIKFKPGYMRLWRDARRIFKTTLNLKFRYQFKLTRYLFRFKTFIKKKLILFQEMKLAVIVLKSKLITNPFLAEDFIKSGYVYINGFVCTNSAFQLFTNDFIQLIVTLKFYIVFKYLHNQYLLKKFKLKKLLSYKSRSHFQPKQRSLRLPHWTLQYNFDTNDIPKYLEVDFLSLSLFILYEPFLVNDLNISSFNTIRYNTLNLYNWKYIT